MDDTSLHEKPSEFFDGFTPSPGCCEAQSILPGENGYVCHCSCGAWDVLAPTREEGLHLARAHTGSVG